MKIPSLHLTEGQAKELLQQFFLHVKKFGGVLILLWHYEDLTPPRTWMMGTYLHVIEVAQKDGAWITTAQNVVEWFRHRRQTGITYSVEGKEMTIFIHQPPRPEHIPGQKVRMHVSPSLIEHIDGESVRGDDFLDILCKPEITVVFR